MSLQPIAIELCQASALRGRRRSSIRPQNLLPLLFTSGGPAPNQNESAIADDSAPPEYPSKDSDVSPPPSTLISPITHAHVSGHSSSFSTSRHQDALSIHKSEITVSPTVSPSTTVVSDDSYFEAKRTSSRDLRLKYRLASVIFLYFLNGWGDGVTGTALPYFKAKFHLSYMISSLLFVFTMCGFMSGTLLVPRINNFLGLFCLSDPKFPLFPTAPWKILCSRPPPNTTGHSPSQARYLLLILASFGSPVAFLLQGNATKMAGFPAICAAFVVIAFARALLTASLNVFLSERRTKCLGYAFGVWSFGGVVSPLIFQATAAAGLPWEHFYFGSLVFSAVSLVFLGITFYPTAREFALDRKNAFSQAAGSQPGRSPAPTPDSDDVPDLTDATLVPSPTSSVNPLRLPYLWTVSLFALLYCGSETTTQGLVVQYLLAERSADPKTVGYVSSGFWAGITVSRVSWSYFSSRISFTGRKYIVQGCLALGMQLLMWLIDSNIENAVSASLIGAFFGPVFPACLELANDLLPAEASMIAMAIVSAAGSLGNAIFPFVTGVVTTKYSMRYWSYMTVTQAAVLFCTWYLFPTRQPPRRAVAL